MNGERFEKTGDNKKLTPKVAHSLKSLSWQIMLEDELDEMVDSFLYFPDDIPQSFQDYQFARHLLWKLSDNKKHFRRLFMQGIKAADLDHFWVRLLPYITGDLPDSISRSNLKVIRLSLRLYEITYDITVSHRSNLDRLMDQVVEMVRDLRSL